MKIKAGVIGLGYWGPNYVRNFARNEQIELIWLCDVQDNALEKIHKTYPNIKLTKNFSHLLRDKDLDLIAVATPPETHYKLCKSALIANKHVLVAKPMTTKSSHAKDLEKIARKRNLLLHCDLTYLYTPAIKAVKDQITTGALGKPLYFDSTRTNLGLIQKDVNVIWDLAPHDLGIINYCFGLKAKKIFTIASKHYSTSRKEEMAHITISYPNSFIAHIHISWLSPIKIRTIFIGGSKKMIFFDDVQPDEKIKIYDKGIAFPQEPASPFKPIYRNGDIFIPKLNNEEALFLETEDIVNQISKRKIDYKNAKLNIEIINLLEACDESLKKNTWINIK